MKIASMTVYAGSEIDLYFNDNSTVNVYYDGSAISGSPLAVTQVTGSLYYCTFASASNDADKTYFFTQGDGNTDEGYLVHFISKTEILATEVSDTGLSANSNSVFGRLLTIEKNQTDVLMPRLRRALGLLGEYQVADAFVYDDDGNITKCRIRIFNNQADAEAAAVWLDTANETDGVPAALDDGNGEVARYEINATNSLPRNLRTKFIQDVEPSQTISDQHYGLKGNDDGTTTSGTNGSVL